MCVCVCVNCDWKLKKKIDYHDYVIDDDDDNDENTMIQND